jgi:class 3 adenylate cyclase/predicted ATPase
VSTIAEWLMSLGMSEYTERFAEERIETDVLAELTDQDLERLGIPLGHRRRMLKAIRELGQPPPAAARVEVAASPAPRDSAERRQLTVVFCDLVGSTELSARLDPEDLRGIIGAYHRRCTELIERNGGFVAKYMGDGVLAYFGYPQAHEHDAERAVRAGLALVEAIPNLETAIAGTTLQVRLGIATGLVVVGDLIGTGEAQERGIVGETPNLAARLQGVAEPNTVVIAENTRKLVGNLFELHELGARDLKGIDGPARAWAVLRASSVESRFEALHATGLTTLVGREEELELLLRRWTRAKTGEGQVVLMAGEAGIGKSRLTIKLLEHLATKPHTRLRYFCSPQHTDSPLYPILGQMERAPGLAHDDTPQARLNKLDALLAQTSTSIKEAALFAEMLSLTNDRRYPTLDLDPQQRRQKTLEALISQLGALTRQNPVLMIFEDVHWTDPTSLEVFGRVVDRIQTIRVLLIMTFRPEFDPPWIEQPHVTAITIKRLTQREVGAMIDSVVGNKLLPAGIRQDVVERTDGIPLFVEEMTKAVVEAEGQGAAERTVAVVPSPALAVPASLRASLMARLDRLGPAKEAAQIGAAIGREFSHALLAAVMRKPEAELGSALDRLIAAGLPFRQGLPPHETYLFKHALVQDAAYGTLLREPRRELHARIAETIQSQFSEIAESQPELLARHYTEAGLTETAASLWGKAGQRSLDPSALIEAVAQFTRSQDQIATLPGTPVLRRDEIKFQVALVNALMHVRGYAAPESKVAEERARLLIEQAEALGEPPEDPLLFFSVLYDLWGVSYVAINGDVMLEHATQFLARAKELGTTAPLPIAHRMMGTTLLCTGDIAQARAHLDRAITFDDAAEHRPPSMRFGQDVRVSILSYRSMALWTLGYPQAAFADAENALKRARVIGHAATLMYALAHALFVHIRCGCYTIANAEADELVALAGEKSALLWKAFGTLHHGCILALTGEVSNAVQTITSGIIAWRSTGATLFMPLWLSHLTGAYAEISKFDDAWRCVDEAVNGMETTKEKWWEAEVHRVAGEIELKLPDPDATKAQACFERALAVAREQQAKSWELRAAMSMARLWRVQGKRQQAHDLLAPVYGWFSEGFDTLDLKEPKLLLDQLSV